jgi:hypothetical protein
MADEGATTSSGSSFGLDFSGPASALSAVKDGVTGALSAVGSFLSKANAPKLPLPNPLLDYASYDYVLGIACLSDYQLAYPDKTYMKNVRLPLICKSANADPSNRIKTAFGSFDFFIDKLEINSTIGLESGSNTNMLNMSFEITEPYSMGMFMISLQQAAWNAGHDNYLDAPFLLTIDFRGSKETGNMANIPGTSRKIPFKFLTCEMTVTEKGAVYKCDCIPTNSPALGKEHAELKTDVSIKGKTVQEVLQTGEKSLQAVLNKRLQSLKKKEIVDYPDEILILFPNKVETAPDPKAQGGKDAAKPPSATTSAATDATAEQIAADLNVTKSKTNSTLVQDAALCNALGKANVIGAGETRKGDAPFGKDNAVYDPALKTMVRGNNIVDPKTGDYRFSQSTDIINAINQVLMTSDYVKTALRESNVSPEGYRQWWRINTKIYHISTKANNKSTGKKPKLIVYEVVPYQVHASKLTPPNTKAPGFEELKKNAVKVYNYIYTGKNADIISFNIVFKVGFTAVMGSAALSETQDVKRTAKASGSDQGAQDKNKPMPKGNEPSKDPGSTPTSVKYVANYVGTDNKGGGGLETSESRAARLFHNALTSGSDLVNLELKIIGDPYYIAQSGQGNYSSKPLTNNLNADGSVNYEGGEVDIVINFRTPIDINQTTGLYDFGKSSKSASVVQFSGVYQIITVASHFVGGQFTQTLTGPRRANQEIKGPADKDKMFNSTKQEVPNNGDGEG